MDDNKNIYVAKVSSLLEESVDLAAYYFDSSCRKSDDLGMFLVQPVTRNKIMGGAVVGFKEVVSGDMIIKGKKTTDNLGEVPITVFVDANYEKGDLSGGDLCWKVFDKVSADNLLSANDIESYKHQSPEAIRSKLNEIRKSAMEVFRENYQKEGISK